jgi:hypothetical protein
MPLCPTSAGSNLRLLTAGKKGKPFSQTFSHPSLRADETHGGRKRFGSSLKKLPELNVAGSNPVTRLSVQD